MKLDFLITVDWDYYKKFMSVNLDGALVYPRGLPDGQARRRRDHQPIVHRGVAVFDFYGLAKAGVNSLTQQLATELGGQNIRINAIAPGPIDTRTTAPPRRRRWSPTS